MVSRVFEYPSTLQENANLTDRQFFESGGIGRASSHDSMVNNHHNTTPQVNLVPSTHPNLALAYSGEDNISKDDLLFVLNDVSWAGAQQSNNAQYHDRAEIPVVSLPKLNRLIRQAALSDLQRSDSHQNQNEMLDALKDNEYGLPLPEFKRTHAFWQSPQMVSEWARPIGIANQPFEQPGTHNSPACVFVPTQVARLAPTKHVFQSVSAKGCAYTAQSTQQLVLQYSREMVKLTDNGPKMPLVIVTCLLLDDPEIAMAARRMCTPLGRDDPDYQKHCRYGPGSKESENEVLFDFSEGVDAKITASSITAFERKPIGNWRSVVFAHLGKVLHTCGAQPRTDQVLRSAIKKSVYDIMPRIQVTVGCR